MSPDLHPLPETLATSINGRVELDLDACLLEEDRLRFVLNWQEPDESEWVEEDGGEWLEWAA